MKNVESRKLEMNPKRSLDGSGLSVFYLIS